MSPLWTLQTYYFIFYQHLGGRFNEHVTVVQRARASGGKPTEIVPWHGVCNVDVQALGYHITNLHLVLVEPQITLCAAAKWGCTTCWSDKTTSQSLHNGVPSREPPRLDPYACPSTTFTRLRLTAHRNRLQPRQTRSLRTHLPALHWWHRQHIWHIHGSDHSCKLPQATLDPLLLTSPTWPLAEGRRCCDLHIAHVSQRGGL